MLTIWGRNNSINVQKAMWTVGELGLAHERIDAGGAFGGVDTPDYLAKNPNARVPTLVDGDFIVWESNAIVRYLAAQYGAGGLWPEDPAVRAVADQWMDWQQTMLLPDLTVVFLGLIRTPPEERDAAAIAAAVTALGPLWQRLDQHLADRDYLLGGGFTMGDIPVGAACYRYHELDIERPALPNIEAWYARLRDRSAFREHVMIPVT